MADTVTKGITITFRGDTVEFDNSVSSMNRAMRLLQNETAKLNRELKLDPTNVDLLNQKLDLLKQREALITEEMKRYEASLVDAIKPTTQLTSTADWIKLSTEIGKAEKDMEDWLTTMESLVNANGQITDPVKWQNARKEYNKAYDAWTDGRIALVELARQNNATFDGNIVQNYTVRMNNLEKELANVQSQADNVEMAINGIGNTNQVQKLNSLGTSLQTLGREFNTVANATQELSRRAREGLGNMVNSASAFETAMAGVAKVLSDDELKSAGLTLGDIAQGIRDMAKEIPATATEIGAIAEMAGQLGIPAENILEFTRVIADLGVATNITGQEGAKAIAQLYNITGENKGTIDNFASAIVELGNNSATTEEDILNMAKMLASAGTSIGLTTPEIVGLATALSSVGISASVGGNNLSKVINTIDKLVGTKSNDLKDWAKLTGMSVKEFSDAWNNAPLSVIEKVLENLGKVNDNGGSLAATLDSLDIKEMRTADTMRRLALSAGSVSDYVAMANGAWEANSALTTEAQKRYQTFDSKLQILNNTLTDLYIELGNNLFPILTPIIEKMKEFIQSLTNAEPNLQKAGVAFTVFIGALSPVSKWLGNVSGGLGTFFKALAEVKDGTDDETTSLGGMARVFENLTNNGFINSASTQLSNLGGVLKNGIDKVKELAINIASTMSGDISLTGAFSKLVDTIKGGPVVWFEKLKTLFTAVWGVITANPIGILVSVLGVLALAIGTAFATSEEFRMKLSALWKKIKDDLKPVIDLLVTAIASLWAWLKEKLNPLLEPLINIAIAFIKTVRELWDLLVNVITWLTNILSPFIKGVWEQLLKPLADWLAGTFVGVLSTIFDWIGKAIEGFKSLLGKANEYIGTANKASKTSGYVDNIFKKPNGINQLRVDALNAFASGGLGINTSGLGTVYNGGTLQLTTNINVNNNGTPISETEIRKWGNTITEIVSDNLGRSFAV